MALSLALALVTLVLRQQDQGDPELSPNGRTHYLGRKIAHTMHWSGADWLMRATREDEENGVRLRQWLAVRKAQSVCDLGCGNGYHTLPLAEAVGAEGEVFAIDLQPEMLELLKERLEERALDNVVRIEATVDDPKLPKESCDLVLMVDVYHELSHPVRVMRHLREALKPGGRVVLVEFRAEDPKVPIHEEHKMTKAQVVRELAAAGFAMTDSFDGLPWQHAMAFTPVEKDVRLAPRQVLRGFLTALAAGDPSIVAPFCAEQVALEDLPPLPADARFEMHAGPRGRLIAELSAHDGSPLRAGRSEVELTVDTEGRWSIAAVSAPGTFESPHGENRDFVVMQTALAGDSLAARAALAAEIGFDGLAWDLDQLADARALCESAGGDLVSAYAVLDLTQDADAALAPIRGAMRTLEGGPGMIWLALQQPGTRPSDATRDDKALAVLPALLRDADATGVEIALYPHSGFWLETTDDAKRLCTKLPHLRLGVCFNLCHFLRTSDETDPTPLLGRCGSRLFAVTVNGADLDGQDWRTLIRPLDEGDFDLRHFLATLDTLHFAGPVGLQGFGITTPARTHLARSMTAWRAVQHR